MLLVPVDMWCLVVTRVIYSKAAYISFFHMIRSYSALCGVTCVVGMSRFLLSKRPHSFSRYAYQNIARVDRVHHIANDKRPLNTGTVERPVAYNLIPSVSFCFFVDAPAPCSNVTSEYATKQVTTTRVKKINNQTTNTNPPDVGASLQWIHGYDGSTCRNNVRYSAGGEVSSAETRVSGSV